MSNQGTFGKRQREQNRKDKARAKQERLAARRAEVRVGKGPPIASFAEADASITNGPTPPEDSMPTDTAISAPAPAHAPTPANREVPRDRPAAPRDRPAAPPPATPRRR
jgi:hypothetical protein